MYSFCEGFPSGLMEKNLPTNAGDAGDANPIPELGRPPGERNGLAPVFLPAKVHGQRSPAGYSPWGCKKLDTTEHGNL